MDFDFVLTQMESNAKAVQALVQDVAAEQARWKPSAEDWSILEVVTHLWDEEIEDFRAHLDLILHHPDQPWPSIDPQGWVAERSYNERDPAESLEVVQETAVKKEYLNSEKNTVNCLRNKIIKDWQTMCITRS